MPEQPNLLGTIEGLLNEASKKATGVLDQARVASITDRLRNSGVNVGAQVDNGVAPAGSAGVDLAFEDKLDQSATMR